MILIHGGVYHWKPRSVAVRDDWCIHCQAPRAAVKVTTFDVVHLYGIPLLPLGRLGRWFCTVCSKAPDEVGTARRSIKLLVAAVFGLVTALIWLEAPRASSSQLVVWGLRFAFAGITASALWWAATASDDVERRRQLETLIPNHLPVCPFCGAAMRPLGQWRCENCNLVHAGRARS